MINKSPMYKFLCWFSFFIFICFIGIFKVCALTNNNSIRFYDNNGTSLTYKTTSYDDTIKESSAVFTTTANSYGGAVLITLNTPLIQNHIYSLFINVGAMNMGGQTQVSSKNCIGVGSNYNNAINSYINCSITPKFTQKSGVTYDTQRGLYFTFISNANAPFIVVPYTSTDTCYDCLQYSYGFDISDGGDTTGLTDTQVNTIINNQTTMIQNQISNMQSNISQTIDTTFNDCHQSYNLFDKSTVSNGYQTTASITTTGFNVNGSWYVQYPFTLSSGTYTINYDLKVNSGSTTSQTGKIRFLYTDNTYSSYYSVPYTFNTDKAISQILFYSDSGTSSVNVNFNNVTIGVGTSSVSYEPYGEEICINKIDQTTNAVNNLNDTINDDNVDSATSDAGDFITSFETDTFGLTSIITAPLNLIQSLTSSTCTPLELPLPYLDNKKLTLPCMSSIYQQHFGSFFTIYQTITYGIIAYWVCVRIFNQVKDFKNPEHDEIEVVDL